MGVTDITITDTALVAGNGDDHTLLQAAILSTKRLSRSLSKEAGGVDDDGKDGSLPVVMRYRASTGEMVEPLSADHDIEAEVDHALAMEAVFFASRAAKKWKGGVQKKKLAKQKTEKEGGGGGSTDLVARAEGGSEAVIDECFEEKGAADDKKSDGGSFLLL